MSENNEQGVECIFSVTDIVGTKFDTLYRGSSVDEILDKLYAKHVKQLWEVNDLHNTFLDEDGDVLNVKLTVTPDMIPAYRQEREQQRILAEKEKQLDAEIADMIERLGKEEVLARLKGYE